MQKNWRYQRDDDGKWWLAGPVKNAYHRCKIAKSVNGDDALQRRNAFSYWYVECVCAWGTHTSTFKNKSYSLWIQIILSGRITCVPRLLNYRLQSTEKKAKKRNGSYTHTRARTHAHTRTHNNDKNKFECTHTLRMKRDVWYAHFFFVENGWWEAIGRKIRGGREVGNWWSEYFWAWQA